MSRGKERTDPYYPLLKVFPHLFLFVFLFLCITNVSSPEGTPDTLCNFYAVIMSLRRSETSSHWTISGILLVLCFLLLLPDWLAQRRGLLMQHLFRAGICNARQGNSSTNILRPDTADCLRLILVQLGAPGCRISIDIQAVCEYA
ncbi:hypothetical protein F4809DRAFT_312822 [Biscogniauxia mediterranea]|nr:hypothetical protein F4809DRAFT_312822 [Biscogniauxia mediterranea]